MCYMVISQDVPGLTKCGMVRFQKRFRRSDYLTYRIITVPENIHQALPNIGNAPLHEFEGKNVGIRFARGEFVACTNQGKSNATNASFDRRANNNDI